jgi:hypothetical protein
LEETINLHKFTRKYNIVIDSLVREWESLTTKNYLTKIVPLISGGQLHGGDERDHGDDVHGIPVGPGHVAAAVGLIIWRGDIIIVAAYAAYAAYAAVVAGLFRHYLLPMWNDDAKQWILEFYREAAIQGIPRKRMR